MGVIIVAQQRSQSPIYNLDMRACTSPVKSALEQKWQLSVVDNCLNKLEAFPNPSFLSDLRSRYIDRQHTNVYLSFVRTLFHLDADHSIYSVYSESATETMTAKATTAY